MFTLNLNDKYLSFIIGGILLFISIFRIPSPSIRALSLFLTHSGVYLLFAVILFFKVNKWVGLFIILTCFSAQFPMLIGINESGQFSSILTLKMKEHAIFTRDCIMIGMFWYFLLNIAITPERIPVIFDFICIISVIIAILVILQHCGYDIYYIVSGGRWTSNNLADPSGVLGNPNTTSGLLAISFRLFFRNRWRICKIPTMPLLAIPIIFGLIFSHASNGPFAIAVGFIFCSIFNIVQYRTDWRIILFFSLVLIIIIVSSVLFYNYVDNPGIQGRLDHWVLGWKPFFKRTWFGYGLGHWKFVTGQLHAHNDIWQMIFQTGIIGAFIMLGYIVQIFKYLNSKTEIFITSIVILIVNSFISFLMHIPTTAIIAITIIALFNIKVQSCQKNHTKVFGLSQGKFQTLQRI